MGFMPKAKPFCPAAASRPGKRSQSLCLSASVVDFFNLCSFLPPSLFSLSPAKPRLKGGLCRDGIHAEGEALLPGRRLPAGQKRSQSLCLSASVVDFFNLCSFLPPSLFSLSPAKPRLRGGLCGDGIHAEGEALLPGRRLPAGQKKESISVPQWWISLFLCFFSLFSMFYSPPPSCLHLSAY
jgi:hypothetical protein